MEELIEYVKNEMVEAREYFDNDEHFDGEEEVKSESIK